MIKRVTTVMGLLVVVCLTACGGSGGGDPAEVVSDPSSTIVASYEADSPAGTANTVFTSEWDAARNYATVNVLISDTNDVYGASFDVVYDSDLADYVEYASGGLLERDGNNPFYQVQEVAAGRLVVVATRSGDVPGVDVSGSETLIRLTFRLEETGSGRIDFENANISNDVPQNLPIQEWAGGTLSGS
jgi:hypothetical protein